MFRATELCVEFLDSLVIMVVFTTLALLIAAVDVSCGTPFHGRIIEREDQLSSSYHYVIIGGGTVCVDLL
jgi:hypothetical protein